jgi:hypothetical protein
MSARTKGKEMDAPKYKKYILFQFGYYYPTGGLGDISESFDNLEEAQEYASKERYDFAEVVDRDTWETVWQQQ